MAQNPALSGYTLEQDGTIIGGLRIPALPVAMQALPHETLLQRFSQLLREMHGLLTDWRRLALLIARQPDIGSTVQIALLCATDCHNEIDGRDSVTQTLKRIQKLLPEDDNFAYGRVQRLTGNELYALLHPQVSNLSALRINKAVERHPVRLLYAYLTDALNRPRFGDVPGYSHCWHPLPETDIMRELIEHIGRQSRYAAILLQIQPARFPASTFQQIAGVIQAYEEAIQQGKERNIRRSHPSENLDQALAQARAHRGNVLDDETIRSAARGVKALNELYGHQSRLFSVAIFALGEADQPGIIAQRICAALTRHNDQLGWRLPELQQVSPEEARSLSRLPTDSFAEALPFLTTAEELAHLFHLPLYPPGSYVTEVALIDNPFPKPGPAQTPSQSSLQLGTMLLRHPSRSGEDESVYADCEELVKPSLIVGAPGSGKTNLAICLVQQWWGKHGFPFLIIDPSAKREFRCLLADDRLSDTLVIFSTGEEDFLPLRFNPLAVPPGVTLDAHINRLMTCFKAGWEMWDPLPAVFLESLKWAYRAKGWSKDSRRDNDRPCPTMADLLTAMQRYIEEEVAEKFAGDPEALGRIRGSGLLRLEELCRSLGDIFNDSAPGFFQRLLEKPTVIELGALGGNDRITLLTAFLIIQLRGYIEYMRPPATYNGAPHLLMIEEAHILLSAEGGGREGTRGRAAEDFSNMLAEVRGFRQGIAILDQRPSSLIGGVFDNTNLALFCRLNDEEGFRRLSSMIGLDENQQRFAKARLQPGQFVMSHPAHKRPILVQPPLVVEELREKAGRLNLKERNAANARARDLMPPVPALRSAQSPVYPWMSREAEESIKKLLRRGNTAAAEENLFDIIEQAPGLSKKERDRLQSNLSSILTRLRQSMLD